jgi:transposase InsO family protein
MTSKPVAFMMADLGVTKIHSRPYVSDDNPYSESHFRTMKYRPEFPDRFGCIQDSRAFCQQFFQFGLLTNFLVNGRGIRTSVYGLGSDAEQLRRLIGDLEQAAKPR